MLQQFFRRKFPQGFLIIIAFIIIFLYFCFVKLLILDTDNWNTVIKIVVLILYNVLFVLLLWSVVESIRTDPGHVPKQWGFQMPNTQRKYCIICHVFKPQRTHHCSTCNRCVLNMDHHCPWINCCVGFYNRKAFILLLFYTIVITAFNILLGLVSIQPLIEAFSSSTFRSIVIAIAFILNCIIFGAILNFFRFHMGLIFSNYTTLEILEIKRQLSIEEDPKSPFDIGRYYNWLQVFGRNWVAWPIPIFLSQEGPSGDGVLWPKFSHQPLGQQISH